MKPNDEHFSKLLDAYFDGRLDDSQREEFERWLVGSDRARGEFWKRAAFEHALEIAAEKRQGLAMLEPARRTSKPRIWHRRIVLVSGWVAAAAAMVALFWAPTSGLPEKPAGKDKGVTAPGAGLATAPDAPSPRSAPRDRWSGPSVAYLSRLAAVENGTGLRAGQSLEAGKDIEFRTGWLQVDFFSGARVVVRGPARLRPLSDMKVLVNEGSASIDVPDSAKGFELLLPDGKVTDFGTEFDVVVAGGRTERLQVLKGEVELAGASGTGARRILEGQAVAVEGDGVPRPLAFRSRGPEDEWGNDGPGDTAARLQHWETESTRWSRDPGMLVHFRFLPEEAGGRDLLNRAASQAAPATGTVVAAEWTRGRWPGKHALSFHNQADRVRVEIPGQYREATFAAWVKADALTRRYNGLFLSESGIQGEVHWQLSEKGEFYFGVRPREERADWSFQRAFSGPVIGTPDLGTWRMLATTYNADEKRVVHYVDGVAVATLEIADPIGLSFGRATLGNFFDPKAKEHAGQAGLGEGWSFRNWNGAIDEFMLFSRALGPGEIGELHESGKP